MTPYQEAGFTELSLFRASVFGYFSKGDIAWLKKDDDTLSPKFSNGNDEGYVNFGVFLEELPKDADGFYLWEGGECPVPGDWEINLDEVSIGAIDYASNIHWQHVMRFKPLSRPDMPSVAECVTEEAGSALEVQEGGDHYKKLKIQPMEYSMANKLDACQHTIIKYVTRFRDKGGIEDLRKAKHCIDLLIEFESEALESQGRCNYPDCKCPFDKTEKCLRGLPEAEEKKQ